MQMPRHGQNGHNGNGSAINRGPGGHPYGNPHHSNGSDVTFHEAGHPLQYPNSHKPVTTELGFMGQDEILE